jgi:hypothetical protein
MELETANNCISDGLYGRFTAKVIQGNMLDQC